MHDGRLRCTVDQYIRLAALAVQGNAPPNSFWDLFWLFFNSLGSSAFR